MPWLEAAGRLPGQALAVGLELWHLAGLRRTRRHLSLSTERLARFGVSRHAKDRALQQLRDAGLVAVDRKKGRSPRVSLLVLTGGSVDA
jgi:DNA-binding transcriptional ArsR family regulator